MLKIYLTINFSLGHYSSCLELHLKFVSFLCDPCLYPFPYMMSTFNHCACATPAFSPPVSSLEPAFQKKEIHKPFIHSFIHPFPAAFLFANRAGSYLCLVTHHQILWGDYAEHHWFTHFWLCQKSMSWQAFPCKYHTRTMLLISRALSQFCLPS